ncbi:MAG: glycosyltransferase family 4 protein [Clostridiales bacterium]|nr:glycosyltransferase family 4 protein [Clostridiales bacterium]MBE5810081.1 glycosyltransferase family 4 protein [Clostridiales bacterium]
MKIHILGTVNGQVNEGMRNVATHISRCYEENHVVVYSGLKQIGSILRNSLSADVTMIFARANKMVYWMTRFVEILCKNVWFVCVQRPDDDFQHLCEMRPLHCNYLAISKADVDQVPCATGYTKFMFEVGINLKKFRPVNAENRRQLKIQYGIDPDKLLAVHVGHCSKGRGLEDFAHLDEQRFERLVIASGMFEDENTVKFLEENGVRIHKGYLEHVEEIYQMADVYVFPTKSNEFVISIPLSVMEALACGTPAVGYQSFVNLQDISCVKGAIACIDSVEELCEAACIQAQSKQEASLLTNALTWDDTATQVLQMMESEKK